MSKGLLPEDFLPKREELREERQIPKESRYFGAQRLKPGHTMYKYHNGVLSACTEEDYESEEIHLQRKGLAYVNADKLQIGNFRKKKTKVVAQPRIDVKKKLKMHPDTLYLSALNIKNAERRFRRMGLSVQLIKI